MRCESCGEREAEINLTQIEGNELTTLHLCSECAAEKGVTGALSSEKAPLADFLAQLGKGAGEATATQAAEPCPYCGTSLADFRKTGRLGCSQCWEQFDSQLRALVRRLHGSTRHVGRVYVSEGSEAGDRFARLADLRRGLQRAVEAEDFEAAADLRDRIYELE